MEKSDVERMKNRCGRKIKAEAANGWNKEDDGRRRRGGGAEKSVLPRFLEEMLLICQEEKLR